MRVVGIGLDLVEIERMADVLQRTGDRFLNRVLHPEDDRSRFARGEGPTHLAGLFAAKEAVMKALGTGMAGANFADIRVRHRDSGQPYVELEGKAAEKAAELGVGAWEISITHSKTTAAAVAIAVG
ncbi:MAG: holo-ACP synthase [Planctomycetota bacterium]